MIRPHDTTTPNAKDTHLVRDMVRQRLVTNDLLERLNKTSNALAPGLSISIPGLSPANSGARTRAARIEKIIWNARQNAATLREQQISDLPDPTQSQIDSLVWLDIQLVLMSPTLGDWFSRKLPPRSVLGKRGGDWIKNDEPVWIEFELVDDFDPEFSEVMPSVLRWRFGRVMCRMSPMPEKSSPRFEFQPFADELKTFVRREQPQVTSELLNAALPRIPELAFAAQFVSSVTIEIGCGRLTSVIPKAPEG